MLLNSIIRNWYVAYQTMPVTINDILHYATIAIFLKLLEFLQQSEMSTDIVPVMGPRL